jgi:predicted HTH domain antitoxin
MTYDEALPLAIGETPAQFEEEARFLLVLKLFELGKISAGKAAEMCGMNKAVFLWKASDLGVPVVRLDKTQLETEFENA